MLITNTIRDKGEIPLIHIALVHANDKMADLLYLAGACYDSQLQSSDTMNRMSIENCHATLKWINQRLSFPLTLLELTRIAVRRNVGKTPHYPYIMSNLPLPNTVKEYMMFSDI